MTSRNGGVRFFGIVALLSAAGPVLAQPTFQRQTIVAMNENTLQVEDPPGSGTWRNLAPNEVPVNFEVRRPDSAPDAPYRDLATLFAILNNAGRRGAIVTSVRGVSRPGRHPGVGSGLHPIPPLPIVQVHVRARVESAGRLPLAVDWRPDGSPKARAVIVGGVHSREWVAIESVMRRLQVYQDDAADKFEERLDDLRDNLRPGTRDCFFAENLHTVFVPILNPGALQATHTHHDQTFMLTNTALPNEQWRLRDGRLRRKNLRDTDGFMTGNDHSGDSDALEGVDLNRNMTHPSSGSTASASLTFQGGAAAPATREPESRDLRALLAEVTARRLSGAAFLDMHAYWPLGVVFLPEARAAAPPGAVDYADRVSNSIFGRLAADNVPGAQLFALGTTDDMALADFGLPAVTVELPDEADVDRLMGGVPRTFNVTPGTTVTFQTPTQQGLKFLVDPNKVSAAATLAGRLMDAALEWAAGPAYVREVLFLQDRTGSGTFDVAAVDSQTEVAYFARQVRVDDFTRRTEVVTGSPAVGPAGVRWLNLDDPVQLVVVFSKPMPAMQPGATPSPNPVAVKLVTAAGVDLVDLSAAGTWQTATLLRSTDGPGGLPASIDSLGAKRYEGDTWIATFDLGSGITIRSGTAHLRVEAVDHLDRELDSSPSTVVEWDRTQAPPQLLNYAPGADTEHQSFGIDTVRPRLRHVP